MSILTPKAFKFLKSYIELDTSSTDGKNYKVAITLLSNFLEKECAFTCETLAIPEMIAHHPNRVNLIAKRFVDKKLPTLIIYNHVDVVPANYDGAFTFQSDTKKIYGRGSSDHKGSTAVVLSALEQLKSQKLRFNLIFLATTDEETDQRDQLSYLSKQLKIPKNALIFDPDTFAGGVTVAHLGCLQLEVLIHGKSAHSAASHFGINAIELSRKLLDFFDNEKKHQERQVSSFPAFPSSQVSQVVSRCNVNMISGGTAPNVIPDLCRLIVDYRFIPEVEVKKEKLKIFERIEHFCAQEHLNVKTSVQVEFEGYSSVHPEISKLSELYKSFSQQSGEYCVMGSTPAAAWAKQLKLPHFGIGVARGDTNMHANNEFAWIEDMLSLEKTLTEFLKE